MSSPCYCTSLRNAARRVSAAYDAALAPAGVTTAQFSLLRVLERAGAMALTELGHLTDLDRSTVGRNVKVLERLALVTLGRGVDQRETTVTLSEAGRHSLELGAPLWAEAQKSMEARLGVGPAVALRDLLNTL